MNLKYKQLSVIGKVWVLAEMFNAGIRDDKNSYILATIKHIEDLIKDEETRSSNAVCENSFEIMLDNISEICDGNNKIEFSNNGIVSQVWKARFDLDEIKRRLKQNYLKNDDTEKLNEIYLEIRKIWIKDLKEKKLSGKERRDLFKIKEEIEDVKIKIENRINRDQINLI